MTEPILTLRNKMDTGMTANRKDTIEGRSKRVMDVARELARDIDNFLAPRPNKDDVAPTPVINALDQIAENLTQAGIALKTAFDAFQQLKSRIR